MLHLDIFEKPSFRPETWLCAYTKPHREFFAAANLERENFEVYLPVTKITRQARMYRIPMFGRYLFVKQCEKQNKLRAVDGIAGIITTNDEPIVIKQQIIDELRNREVNGIIQTEEIRIATPGFCPGERVRITSGAHSGLIGYFERLVNKRRAQVHIEGRGALCQVNIGLDAIMSQAEYPGVSV